MTTKTISELAREALPCEQTKRLKRITGLGESPTCADVWTKGTARCQNCRHRPAVESVLREMREMCAIHVQRESDVGDYIAEEVRRLGDPPRHPGGSDE